VTIVVDNCLPLSWVEFLCRHGHDARHWRELGAPSAPDAEILGWALEHGAVVLTQDLDFTRLLFAGRASLPSVIQLRLDDIRPRYIGEHVVQVLKQQDAELRRGAMITVRAGKSRVRLLPLGD
jgi:predicted nuclease of predicted toxin-antitoxin system